VIARAASAGRVTGRTRACAAGIAGAGVAGALTAIAMGAHPAVAVTGGVASASVLAAVALVDWTFGLCAFTAWLAVGDLLRKLTGNSLLLLGATELIAAAAIARFAWEWWHGRVPRLTTPISTPLAVLAAWTLVRTFPGLASDPRVALNGIHAWLAFTPLLYAGYALHRSNDGAAWTAVALAVGALAGFGGLLQAGLGLDVLNPSDTGGLPLKLLHSYSDLTSIARPNSVFMHASRFAGVMLALFWLVPAALASARSVAWRRMILMAAVVIGVAIVLSGQRATLVCLAAGVVLGLGTVSPTLLTLGPRRLSLILGTAVLLGLLVGTLFAESALRYFYVELFSPGEFADTLAQLKYTVGGMHAAVATSLWGHGTGTASVGRSYALGVPWNDASVMPVEGGTSVLLWEWGVAGPLIWLWLVWTVGRELWRRARSASGAPTALVCTGALAAALTSMGLWFHLTAGAYQSYPLQALLWLTVGSALAAGDGPAADRTPPRAA